VEVLIVETQQPQTAPAWRGFFLIVVGLLMFIVSYFLLPLFVTTFNCDSCTPPKHYSAWESSLIFLLHLPNDPFIYSVILTFHYLPLLATLMIFGSSIGYFIHPRRFFVRWLGWSWLLGICFLFIILPFLFTFIRPEIGYLGMLVSYGPFYGGYHLFLAAHPEWQRAP
jgi:hypothetical protein